MDEGKTERTVESWLSIPEIKVLLLRVWFRIIALGGRGTGSLSTEFMEYYKVPALELGCDLLKCPGPSMENMIRSRHCFSWLPAHSGFTVLRSPF